MTNEDDGRWRGWSTRSRVVGAGTTKGRCAMGAQSDQVKGHVKEAVGDLIGDKDPAAEGKTDRRIGAVEEKIDDAKDKVEEVVDKAKDALHRE